jgi:hypothetical protein
MGLSLRTKPIHADLSLNMNNALKHGFSPFRDEETLRYAVDIICAKHGKVKSLRIFPASRDPHGAGRHCLCLLQLDPPEAHAALRSRLRVSIFGDELAFVADVDENWTGPSM